MSPSWLQNLTAFGTGAARFRGRAKSARLERIVYGGLDPDERRRILIDLHTLWSEFYSGADLDTFERVHLRPETRLVTARDRTRLTGFGYVNAKVVGLSRREVFLVSGGIFNRPEAKTTVPVGLMLLGEAMALQRRHKALPAYAMSIAANPVSYLLVEQMVPVLWPRPGDEGPDEVRELVRHESLARDLPLRDGDAYVARWFARSTQAERLRASRTYRRQEPALVWYEQRLPDWHAGHVLFSVMPLDLSNVGRTVWSLLRRRGLAPLRRFVAPGSARRGGP